MRKIHSSLVKYYNNEHLESVLSATNKGHNALSEYVRRLQSSSYSLVKSYFSRPKWVSVNSPIYTNVTDINESYIKVKAIKIFREKTYLFAEDENGKEYFLHFKRIANISESKWFRIMENDVLSVKCSSAEEKDKRIFVERAWLVSS